MTNKIREQLMSGTLPQKHFTKHQCRLMLQVDIVAFTRWYDRDLLTYDKGVYLLKSNNNIVLKGNTAIDISVIPNEKYDNIGFSKFLKLTPYQMMYLLYKYYTLTKKNVYTSMVDVTIPDVLFQQRLSEGIYYQDTGNKRIIANLIRTNGLSAETVRSLYEQELIFCQQVNLSEWLILFPLFDVNDPTRIMAFECHSSLSMNKGKTSIIKKASAIEENYAFIYNGQAIDKTMSVMEYLRLF